MYVQSLLIQPGICLEHLGETGVTSSECSEVEGICSVWERGPHVSNQTSVLLNEDSEEYGEVSRSDGKTNMKTKTEFPW